MNEAEDEFEPQDAHDPQEQMETEYQNLLFNYWSWHRRLRPEEFSVFKNLKIIPRYLWSHEDFLAFDFSWHFLSTRCRLLKDTIKRINKVSRLLSDPQEMRRADGWDRLVASTREYRCNFIHNVNPIESTSDFA